MVLNLVKDFAQNNPNFHSKELEIQIIPIERFDNE